MALPQKWSISARSHSCSLSGEKFTDGQTFYTAIYPDPDSSGYLRRDFSESSWSQRPAAYQRPFSSWKNTYHAPEKEDTETVTREDAKTLLTRLLEEDEEHTENTRYILALMLERKKLLRETDHQRTPSGTLRIYEHRNSKEILIIRDPNIPLSELPALQLEVSALLNNADTIAKKNEAS